MNKPAGIRIRDNRLFGFIQVDNIILDVFLPKIGPSAYVVYCILVRHSRESHAYPGIKCMEKETGMSRNTILKGIETLEQHELIHVVRSEKNGSRDHNEYWILDVSNFDTLKTSGAENELVDKKRVQKLTESSAEFDKRAVQNLNINKSLLNNTKETTNKSVVVSLATPVSNTPPEVNSDDEDTTVRLTIAGIRPEAAARELLHRAGRARCEKHLREGKYKIKENPGGWLRGAIEKDVSEVKPFPPAKPVAPAQMLRTARPDASLCLLGTAEGASQARGLKAKLKEKLSYDSASNA